MHSINIFIEPNEVATRVAVQALDGELDKANALNGPGVVFAQVFPQILENGGVLGVNLKAVVLNNEQGLKCSPHTRG